ncbi:GUN4 domain protein [[Leptolyngbya] sp. PCC 7376]|uniref:GUN4 domain-containing protein n=1 Tax=[Leptolyngbya] sp. PCC 7376 TaxID=111781 RepID=UPI00029F042F|nr:GUN4 domain-containing protein [[Leptolyngbya] sp. PCC 7376]AFY37700.1 GUN4 domain protein [[Leptolyngbya] sp. PCC 7376]
MSYPYLLENPNWVFNQPSDKEIIESLPSLQDVDYQPLKLLLQNKKWEEADKENQKVLGRLLFPGSSGFYFLQAKEIKKMPCTDLLTIDRLWMTFSDHRFGYSIQRDIVEKDNQLISPKEIRQTCVNKCPIERPRTINSEKCTFDCETQRIQAEFERIPEEMGRGKSQVNVPFPMGYYPSPPDLLSDHPANIYRALAERANRCQI